MAPFVGRRDPTEPTEQLGHAPACKYDAFISYSHFGDRDLARSVEKTLWTFGRKWYQLRGVHTYRDETNLAAEPDFWPTIKEAVQKSKCLVLLASPASARSKWISLEVEAFINDRGPGGLCLVQTEGVLLWTDKISAEDMLQNPESALNQSVWLLYENSKIEPLVTDLRPFRSMPEHKRRKDPEFLSHVAAIAAKALGKGKDEIWGQYYRAQRLRAAFLTILSVVLVGLLAAILIAWRAEVRATQRETQQRLLAQQNATKNLARSLSEQAELVGFHSEQVRDWPELVQTSVLLAVEGNSRLDTLETSQSLRNALDRLPRSARLVGTNISADVLVFDPTGTYLAILTTDDKAIRIWRVKDGKELAPLPCDCKNFKFSADGHYLGAVEENGAKVWRVETGASIWDGQYADVKDLALDPKGQYLAIVDGDFAYLVDITGKAPAKQLRPKGGATAIGFAEDGAVFATAVDSRDSSLQEQTGSTGRFTCVWSRKGALLRCLPENHEVTALTFSSSATGHLLATAGEQTASVWDLTRWQKTSELRGINDDPQWIHFGPNDTLGFMGSASEDSTVYISETWDILTSHKLKDLGDRDGMNNLIPPAATWDGKFVGIVRNYGIEIWNVATGGREKDVIIPDKEADVDSIGYQQDGRLAVLTKSGSLWLYDTNSRQQLATATRRYDATVRSISYSPNGKYAAIASGNIVSVWDLEAATECNRLPHNGEVYRIAFSPDNTLLATTAGDNIARLWKIPLGQVLTTIPNVRAMGYDEEHDAGESGSYPKVKDIDFSPKGSYVMVEDDDGIRAWTVKSGMPVFRISGLVKHDTFDPTERYFAVQYIDAGRTDVSRIYDLEKKNDVTSTHILCFSSDGRAVVAESQTGLEIRDLATDHKFPLSPKAANTTCSPAGQYLIVLNIPNGSSRSADERAIAWDLALSKSVLAQSYTGSAGLVKQFGVSGQYVAAQLGDAVFIWNLQDTELVSQVRISAKVSTMDLSSDGRYFVAGSDNGAVVLVDLAKQKEIARFAHEGNVEVAMFSPDSKLIATAGGDMIVRVWSTGDGQELARLNHHGAIYWMKFSSDSSSLTTIAAAQSTTSTTTELVKWPLRSADLRSLACSGLVRKELSPVDWQLYAGTEPRTNTCDKAPPQR